MSETTPAIRQAAATDWITYFDDLAKGELSGRIVRFDNSIKRDRKNLSPHPVGYWTIS
jgi:hypothetical protein